MKGPVDFFVRDAVNNAEMQLFERKKIKYREIISSHEYTFQRTLQIFLQVFLTRIRVSIKDLHTLSNAIHTLFNAIPSNANSAIITNIPLKMGFFNPQGSLKEEPIFFPIWIFL